MAVYVAAITLLIHHFNDREIKQYGRVQSLLTGIQRKGYIN